jgi:hypothetical protein
LIQQDQKWQYTKLNPTAPTIKGLIKIHKIDYPIRPIVNWRNAPAYKLAKLFNNKLNELSLLPFVFNIKNITRVTKSLKEIPLNANSRLASLDIKNMYTNIPIRETKNILENALKNSLVNPNEAKEILSWYDVITQQNYFIFNNTVYTQTDGLATGAPSSSVISELFLQYNECNILAPIVNKHGISGYYRYVDDILILYDSSITNILSILHDFNNIHSNLQFTSETEIENDINYLDISIHRTDSDLTFQIYRKPTSTDTIIPHDSCHPIQHKHAAVRFLYNRLHTYDLDEDAKSKELNIIHNVLHNNMFPLQTYNFTSRNTNINHTLTQPQTHTQMGHFHLRPKRITIHHTNLQEY